MRCLYRDLRLETRARTGDNNPHGKSVTEMEYTAAEKITRLLFLLDTANWPDEMRDEDVTKITALRTKFKRTAPRVLLRC